MKLFSDPISVPLNRKVGRPRLSNTISLLSVRLMIQCAPLTLPGQTQ